jgi:alkane 1-monooxygenase
VSWKQPKRYLWLIPAATPVFVYASWLGVLITGVEAFWWTGPILAFGVLPVLDHMIGRHPDNPPESVLAAPPT